MCSDFFKFEAISYFYTAYKHIISKDTSPTSEGSSPGLNTPLLMRNINEYNINIIKIMMHDYILIQSTQLFCKAVASYPSGGVGYHGSRRWPLILRAGFGYHDVLLSSIAIPR